MKHTKQHTQTLNFLATDEASMPNEPTQPLFASEKMNPLHSASLSTQTSQTAQTFQIMQMIKPAQIAHQSTMFKAVVKASWIATLLTGVLALNQPIYAQISLNPASVSNMSNAISNAANLNAINVQNLGVSAQNLPQVRIDLQFNQMQALTKKPLLVNFKDRIIVDLPNITAQLPASINSNHEIVRDIKTSTQDGKTRVVILLNRPVSAELMPTSDAWQIKLTAKAEAVESNLITGAQNAAPVAANAFVNNDKSQMYQSAVENIDFQRTAAGGAKVIITLNNKDSNVDVRTAGSGLIVDLINTKTPERLKRNYNVNDFVTPVKSMSLQSTARGSRLEILPKGAWKHSSYQTDNRFIVEIQPILAQAKTQNDGVDRSASSNKKYTGNRLSLNFQDIEVRALMQVFADFTGLNIVVNDNVQGSLTLRLKDIPWDQAFDIVMETKGLGYKKNGNVIWVAPKEELDAKEKQRLEARAQMAELEPLRTQYIQLNYHKADTVAKGILGSGEGEAGSAKSMLSKRGSISFDTRTNQLFVTDTPSKIDEINDLVKKIDIPVRQVMIEARIVEADDKFGKTLGAKLGAWGTTIKRGADYRSGMRVSGSQSGVVEASGLLSTSTDGISDIGLTNFISLPAAGIFGNQAASLGVTLVSSAVGGLLNLELSALEADGKGKIVSSPRVVTTDKQKALIEQGTELPYQAATSSGATSVQFKKANLKLEVTPQITPEGKVFLDVDINKDTPSAISNGSAGLAIDTKHLQTQVLVDNGGTVMLGGIFQEEERSSTAKVPVLGDIPYLGRLFKTNSKTKNRTELIIFLTPKVIEESTLNK